MLKGDFWKQNWNNYAEAEHVDFFIVFLVTEDLGGDVASGAAVLHFFGLHFVDAQAKVNNFQQNRVIHLTQQNITRLQIPMYNPLLVHIAQTIQQILCQQRCILFLIHPPFSKLCHQILSVNQLNNKYHEVLCLKHLIQLNYVGVFQVPQNSYFVY